MHGPAGRPHRDFRAPYCTLRRCQAGGGADAPAGKRASRPGTETAPHSQTQKTVRQSRKRNRKRKSIESRKDRNLTATMCRRPLPLLQQPLQLAVSLQLPLQLLDRGVHPDCTLRRPFYAPTPTVRTNVPASPASQVVADKSCTCARFTAALSRQGL